ncbi:N-6 DNA methylase [uncultured Methanobrevibacter sp.]|uniref:restriction endonuclease subunit M n=1 Tax=uncultured Methanobrevibacter sp. TaxID=253161 RepID=UPI0025EFADA5|nr:N-6 DNA methylase [uncultured Methanobrevibacter sp.]
MAKEKIIDYISGKEVYATPEEIEAVQVFSRMLVEDYGYKKSQIVTHPQWRVKARPSDTKKEYPVDIAVFKDDNINDDNILIIVECKKPNRKDGRTELEDYLRFSKARLGVWFNGNEKLFLEKIEKDGQIIFDDTLPNIPKAGQRVEDIGRFKRKDLKPAENLKSIFSTMRNYLAPNVVGASRDEVLAQQLINIIFCKIYDEKFTKPDDMVKFRAGKNESFDDVKERIVKLFELVTLQYSDIIDETDKIILDSKSVAYIVGELQQFSLLESKRDAIGDAFEVFIDGALKGGQGQFFTPRNVVRMIIDILNPTKDDLIIDPACGSGGFLIEALRHVWAEVDDFGKEYNWPDNEIETEKQKVAIDKIRGIDKDAFLTKVCKAYMAILGDGRGGIFCENSLVSPKEWDFKTQNKISLNSFDIVVTNPPFGEKIKVEGKDILKQFKVGHKWKKNKKDKSWEMGKLKDKEAPQYLFIERCLDLLVPGGKMGIVLPDGVLGNDKLGYLRQYISENAQILAVIDVPLETFMPHTSTKTSVLILKKLSKEDIPDDYPIFMAVCDTCGHDRKGKFTNDDDISRVAEKYHEWCRLNVNY